MGKRIDYIDYLKGLSIIWVVWYHTVHPWFAEFSFRIPLFFFASGIFYKVVDLKTYFAKKTNQLFIPFVFFYLVYYVYLILQNYFSSKGISDFNFACIWGVFKPYSETNSFTVDPPLWFICALFCQQMLTWLLVKTLKRTWLIAVAAILISALGRIYVWEQPTYLMFGRSLPYVVYYVFGYLYGKKLINIIETQSHQKYILFSIALCVYGSALCIKMFTSVNPVVVTYFETFGLIILLIYLFKYIYKFSFARPFHFFGRNSYTVLGMHEIYLTILTIAYQHLVGPVNVWSGALLTILTLCLLYPTIIWTNKHIPILVGKGNLIKA